MRIYFHCYYHYVQFIYYDHSFSITCRPFSFAIQQISWAILVPSPGGLKEEKKKWRNNYNDITQQNSLWNVRNSWLAGPVHKYSDIVSNANFLSVLKKKNTCPHVAHQIVIARPQVCRGILVFHRLKYKRFSSNQVFHQVNKLIRNGFWKSSSWLTCLIL